MNNTGEDCISEELSTMKSCAVPGCRNAENISSDVHFFPFPLNANRCLQWLLMCNRKDLVSHLTETLNKNFNVCSIHFTPNSFVKNHKKLLKATSVPTLHLKKDASFNDSNDVLSADCASSIAVLLRDNNFSSNTLDESFLISNENFASEDLNIARGETNVVLSICRLCSESNSENNSMLNILDASNIFDQINACLPIKVLPTDALPKNICLECRTRLEKHFKFHQIVLESDNVLKEMFEQICEVSAADQHCSDDPLPGKKLYLATVNPSIHNDHIYAEVLLDTNEELNERIVTLIADDDNCVNSGSDLIDHMNTFSDDISENIIIESVDASPVVQDVMKSNIEIINIVKNEEKYDESMLVLENTPMYMCNLCNGLAPDVDSFYSHSLNNHSTADGNYVCVLCDSATCFTKDQLFSHMNLHKYSGLQEDSSVDTNSQEAVVDSGNKTKTSYFCGFCNKRFKSKHRMEFHMKFHMGQKPGFCTLCNKNFPDENLLYRHVWYLHRGGRARRALNSARKSQKIIKSQITELSKDYASKSCLECGQSFDILSACMIHEETTHGRRRYCHQCQHCMEAFANSVQLKRHVLNEHGYLIRAEQEAKVTFVNCLYQCEYCSKLYTKVSCLDNHRQVHHGKHPVFLCRYCSEEFSCHQAFLTHAAMKSEHHTSHNEDCPKEPTVKIFFCCQYCSQKFTSLDKMMAHMVRHSPEPARDSPEPVSTECTVCGILFASIAEADVHEANVHPISGQENPPSRPHLCQYCPKSFASESALVIHTRTHTGERPFKCDFCGKSFSQSSSLITHTKTHTDERPYCCTQCNKTFKIKGDLNNHMRLHSELRPFECKTCHKTFKTQNVYGQHCKIHMDHRPHICQICGDAFRRTHTLHVHTLRHSGEKPHACHLCEKHYRQRGDLLKHLRAQHGVTSKNSQQKIKKQETDTT